MLSKKEYIFMLVALIFSFLGISFFCKIYTMKPALKEKLIVSYFVMILLKTIYDIIYKTGYKKIYKYSDSTNQKLRYLSFSMALMIVSFVFYFFIKKI